MGDHKDEIIRFEILPRKYNCFDLLAEFCENADDCKHAMDKGMKIFYQTATKN